MRGGWPLYTSGPEGKRERDGQELQHLGGGRVQGRGANRSGVAHAHMSTHGCLSMMHRNPVIKPTHTHTLYHSLGIPRLSQTQTLTIPQSPPQTPPTPLLGLPWIHVHPPHSPTHTCVVHVATALCLFVPVAGLGAVADGHVLRLGADPGSGGAVRPAAQAQMKGDRRGSGRG